LALLCALHFGILGLINIITFAFNTIEFFTLREIIKKFDDYPPPVVIAWSD
jgi:hypothetical protein